MTSNTIPITGGPHADMLVGPNSAQSARNLGLLIADNTLHQEDPNEFAEILAGFIADLEPVRRFRNPVRPQYGTRHRTPKPSLPHRNLGSLQYRPLHLPLPRVQHHGRTVSRKQSTTCPCCARKPWPGAASISATVLSN